MTEPIFDHERLDVYRLAIEYVASSYRIAKALNGPERHARDQWLRAAQSIPLNIAEGNGKQSLKDKNRFFEIARGSAFECSAIHDILVSFKAIDSELNRIGKTNLKRIASMLTRLIQRTDTVSEGSIEYERDRRGTHHFFGWVVFFGFRYNSISVRTYDLDHSFTVVSALARRLRAEVFDPSEVALLHRFARVVRKCLLLSVDPVTNVGFEAVTFLWQRLTPCCSNPFEGRRDITLRRNEFVGKKSKPFRAGNNGTECTEYHSTTDPFQQLPIGLLRGGRAAGRTHGSGQTLAM